MLLLMQIRRIRAGSSCSGPTLYTEEYWDNVFNYSYATPVKLTSIGKVRDDIEFHLEIAGSISGHIYDEAGYPVEGACVNIYTDPYNWVQVAGWGQTDENGYFYFTGLPAGEFYIHTHANCSEGNPTLIDEWYAVGGSSWDGEDADPVTIIAGEELTGIDFQLDIGGTISGTITDNLGAPLQNIHVEFRWTWNWRWDVYG